MSQSDKMFPKLSFRLKMEQKRIQRKNKRKLMKLIRKKYSMYDSEWVINMLMSICVDFYEYYKMGFNVYSADTKEQEESLGELADLIRRMVETHDCDYRQEDVEELFDKVGKHIREWWD